MSDVEEDSDFNISKNECADKDDMLYNQNVTEGIEDEIDDLEYPSSEEQLSSYDSNDEKVLRTNPSSSVIIGVHDQIFHGIYIYFAACKEGFMRGCRKLIGLDGCHLRSKYGGQLLTAVAIDVNDCIYPVAFAVVEKENTFSWRWFITHLDEDVGIHNDGD
ncbi:MuDR family transposase [Abeliophyllum distichum]|uniref:MuDR family transposase n=1 Tax=Abeliophyllum distichum TaxID=126358 RepID=A0ABD1V7W5_9LAMI